MKTNKRAGRRHTAEKRKAWAARLWCQRNMPDASPVRVGKTAATPHPCSCWGCGNPRRYLGEATMQERRTGGKTW